MRLHTEVDLKMEFHDDSRIHEVKIGFGSEGELVQSVGRFSYMCAIDTLLTVRPAPTWARWLRSWPARQPAPFPASSPLLSPDMQKPLRKPKKPKKSKPTSQKHSKNHRKKQKNKKNNYFLGEPEIWRLGWPGKPPCNSSRNNVFFCFFDFSCGFCYAFGK